MVSKWIGETEKNLAAAFEAAERGEAALLFDEADALFGQRSEVRDSHDRYANIEVAYLLQRMETFDGLAILATNLRSNIDEAFTRRLDIVVDFPMPDRDLRRRLWTHCLSPLQLGDDLDLDFCAESFELSGGDIRAIAITIAYRAAAQGRPVHMVDVITAIGQEYRKMGRLCLEAEFGRYHPLLRA
jgi:SpoVK/Ycf46/Vps4 family AAA+-type ATPase